MMVEVETDQAGNEALAWLERVYQHGVSGCPISSVATLPVHNSWVAAVLCCCAPRHGLSVLCPCPACLVPPAQKSTPKASLFSYFRGETKQEDLTVRALQRAPPGWHPALRSAVSLFGRHRMHPTLNQCGCASCSCLWSTW